MLAQFALRLLTGMGLAWAVFPRPQITSGFFRIQCLLALALGVLATVTVGDFSVGAVAVDGDATAAAPTDPAFVVPPALAVAACAGLAACAFAGSVAWTLERRKGGTAFLFAVLFGAAALLVAKAAMEVAQKSLGARIYLGASELAAAGVIGSCVTGMLLGHWYLTAPTMSIAPLGRANLWFGVCLALRGALAGVALWLARGQLSGTTHQVWLALRWIAGLGLPLLLCVMTAKILKYRNTQSATGVLFASVILVFLGELAGTLLSREIGWPM